MRFGAPEPLVIWAPNSTRPAQIWPYACVPDPNRSEPSREGRASVCNRAVERRFRALFQDGRFCICDYVSDFGVVICKTAISRKGKIGDLAPKPVVL